MNNESLLFEIKLINKTLWRLEDEGKIFAGMSGVDPSFVSKDTHTKIEWPLKYFYVESTNTKLIDRLQKMRKRYETLVKKLQCAQYDNLITSSNYP